MTDKKTDAVATIDKNTALEPAPSYIKTGREGLEGISKTDMLLPRLALAQNGSPQVTEGDPNRICIANGAAVDLQVGDLYNSLTSQVYGKEVHVQVLRKDAPRAMEWKPLDEGGGMIDPNVPLHDERLKWGPNGEKPIATLYRDYIAVLLPSRELISLSFKSSGIKVAKSLNGLIAMRNRPIYAGRYVIKTAIELKPKPHRIYKVDNAGWVSEADATSGEQMYLAVKDLDVQIDRSVHDDPDSFDPETIEAQGRQPEM